MCNWKTHLESLLIGLSRTHGKAPLSEIQRILRGVLEVEELTFFDHAGQPLHESATLPQLLERAWYVSVRLACPRGADEPLPASRFREGVPPVEAQDLVADPRCEHFLQEFLRLEQHHEFMWAGYVVRELLPRLGFAPEEAKIVLDRLRAENLIKISKVTNPKNPDFPATGVHLNHEHPRIKALLAQVTDSNPAPAAPNVGTENV
jgi:hypothetical protein